MSLADVRFQDHALRQVQRALDHDRLPHAYIFHGPIGVGKETFALGLAEALLCGSPTVQETKSSDSTSDSTIEVAVGCGNCEDCRTVAVQTHPDLHIVHRQLVREHPDATIRKRKALDIGVDVLRYFLIDRVNRTPVRGRAKVFVLREAERMTPQAQNALLKTLEEPPGKTLLILSASSLDRLLPTTLSRCQILRFNTLPTSFVRERIEAEHAGLSSEALDWYARQSAGSVGQGLDLARRDCYTLFRRVVSGLSDGKRDERVPFTSKAWIDEAKSLGTNLRKDDPDMSDTDAGRQALKMLLALTADWYAGRMRDLVSFPTRQTEDARESQAPDTKANGMTMTPQIAIQAVNRIALTAQQLDRNVNTQLCIETLINDLRRLN